MNYKFDAHLKQLRSGSGAKALSQASWRGGITAVLRMAGKFLRSRAKEVSDLDFDTRAFPMRQSARVSIDRGAGPVAAFVKIPIGASGRDHDEAERVVEWRCNQAFGTRGEDVFKAATRPGTSVAALYTATRA